MSALSPEADLIALDDRQLVGSIEDRLSPLIKTSFLDGTLRFVAAIAGWIFLPVGCFFRQSKLA